jgi:hypothetical protein
MSRVNVSTINWCSELWASAVLGDCDLGVRRSPDRLHGTNLFAARDFKADKSPHRH